MEQTVEFSIVEQMFHLSVNPHPHAVIAMPAADLLKPGEMKRVLDVSAEALEATDLALAVSFAGLTFFNLCAAMQIYVAQNDRLLDLRLEGMTFQLVQHGERFFGAFRIGEIEGTPLEEGNRLQQLEAGLTAFYRETVAPLIQAAAAGAGLKPDLIWNQYGARMAYFRNYIESNETRDIVKTRFFRDFELLAYGLSAEVFGRRKNPFAHTPRYIDHYANPEERIMMRSSCCMYDRRKNGEKCYNCPRLTDSERERMRVKLAESRS